MIKDKSEKILNIATKRGFFFPTAEIYGSRAGFWTYGHLGKLMKIKFENLWRSYFLSLNSNYFEIEGNSILPEAVFKASGHLEKFNDPLVECTKCHSRYRHEDLIVITETLKNSAGVFDLDLIDQAIKHQKIKCPRCGSQLDKAAMYNLMFDVKLGATGEDKAFLSPETAQNPYLSFKREFFALREKLPLGLAMIGKAFRNEISPRQGFFRLREFTQAELQIFFNSDELDKSENWHMVKDYKLNLFLSKDKKISKLICEDANKKLKLPRFYVYHLARIQQFYLDILKIPNEFFRFRELADDERAFYNKLHFDIELNLETLNGWKEVAGLHFRTDYDLKRHQETSKESLEVNIDNKKILPHVLEVSFGMDRNIWALLDIFYAEEKERNLFKFPNSVTPIFVAVFPLLTNDEKLVKKAKDVYSDLNKEFITSYDESGSIGRMYRRTDEIGCPYAITIDHQTLKDDSVTLRKRDSMKQTRVKVKDLITTLRVHYIN